MVPPKFSYFLPTESTPCSFLAPNKTQWQERVACGIPRLPLFLLHVPLRLPALSTLHLQACGFGPGFLLSHHATLGHAFQGELTAHPLPGPRDPAAIRKVCLGTVPWAGGALGHWPGFWTHVGRQTWVPNLLVSGASGTCPVGATPQGRAPGPAVSPALFHGPAILPLQAQQGRREQWPEY